MLTIFSREAIGQLSGGIARDFNNPLGVIIGYLDFLQGYTADDEKPHKWAATATRATMRCMDLTRQLLAFSRKESKIKSVVNLNATLDELKTMIARSVTPEVEVQTFLANDLRLTEIDPGEFQDVILNLVINARDAMPGGGQLLIETSNKYLDDKTDLLQLADKYLTDLGYHTYLAENANQALDILSTRSEIDLLFSDIVMPGGMNGYELAQKAAEKSPRLKVLLTSGFTSKTIVHDGQALFSAQVLNKPYRMVELAKTIRLVLDRETG